jgi:Flp pilus assembly pilin Flp
VACESIRSRLRCCDYRFLEHATLSLSSGNVRADHPTEGYASARRKTMNRTRLTRQAKRRASERKDVSGVSRMFARIRVDSTHSISSTTAVHGADAAPESPEGGESTLSLTDLITYVRARFGVEEGQTMAEYGVVLAVITVAIVAVLGFLADDIMAALNAVRSALT